MKMKYVITSLICLCILLSCVLVYVRLSFRPICLDNYFGFSLPDEVVKNWGFIYPITFKFGLPVNTSENLHVWYSYNNYTWVSLCQRTSANFFNGESIYRFDYSNSKVYISVAFNECSHLYVGITDSSGRSLNMTYEGVTQYYDNRKAVVTSSHDEYYDNTAEFMDKAIDIFQSYKLCFGVGIVTEKCNATTWSRIQQQINEGYVGVESHSRTHTSPFENGYNYTSEVVGSKQDIIGNLTLPHGQYVNVFTLPYGLIPDVKFSEFIKAHYVFVRTVSINCDTWASWTINNETKNPITDDLSTGQQILQILLYINGFSARMGGNDPWGGTSDIAVLNSKFDSVYNSGGIYNLFSHPYYWVNESSCLQHLAYISNRLDVWYVNLGDLYTYHYVQAFCNWTEIHKI